VSSLFGKAPLVERYRPATWAEVVGQERIVGRIRQLAQRDALAGRAYWLSGQSGTGKTTIARLLAAEVADDFSTQEVDASALTVAALRELERESQVSGWGEKGGRAYLVNEAHGLRKDVIRQFLVLLERIPSHVVWLFTTTTEGEQGLFEDYDDAGPLLSRCPWRAVTLLRSSRSAARKSRSAKGSTAGRWTSTSG
jgi:replication-associated recombination protein RarA